MKPTHCMGCEHRPSEAIAQRLAGLSEPVRLAHRRGFDGVTIGKHLSTALAACFPPIETAIDAAYCPIIQEVA